jgi:predicted acyl esterase
VSKPKYENYGLPYHCCHREDAQPLILSEPAQLIFAFLPASHICKAGYRIRISVAGSDYRERDRAPVSPAPIVTILNTPSNPSYISLPVIDLKNVRDHKKGED